MADRQRSSRDRLGENSREFSTAGQEERRFTIIRTFDQLARTLKHPDLGDLRVDQVICLYGWHGRHHVAHVTAARKRLGW